MANIIYNQNLHTEIPTLLLKGRDFATIGAITASRIVYKNNFNSANELSFNVYKTIDGEINCLWDKINDYNLIYLPEYEECFDIQVSLTEDTGIYKTVTCKSLAEVELSQTLLYDIEINTEADMKRPDYNPDFPTIFYRGTDTSASLLHRILSKASHYKIGYVSKTLRDLKTFYEFSFSETSIYEALTGEIAQQYQCLFTFVIKPDGTRLVNAYDLCNTCSSCGYRGDFHDKCPECGNTLFEGAYGEDTTIYIDKDNLASSASIESNKEELKNCFRVSGGDELMTATVANCNPNGTNYFWSFPPEVLENMPASLSDKIVSYNEEYQECMDSGSFHLQTAHVDKYNAAITYVLSRFPDAPYQKISSKINGYRNVSRLIYDVIDLKGYLDSAMMPVPDIDGQSMDDAIQIITDKLSAIAVSDPSRSSDRIINNAIIEMAKAYINTALYRVNIEEQDYHYEAAPSKEGTGRWRGQLTLTAISDDSQTKKTPMLTLSIDNNESRYLQQKLDAAMSKSDNNIREITDMELPFTEFCQRITFYSLNCLINTMTAFDDCLTLILNSENKDLQDNMKGPYQERASKIAEQITFLAAIQDDIEALYQELISIQNDVKNEWDFEAWIGRDLWRVFCSYRREDSYKNDNFKSDGLSNSQLIEQAEKLIQTAKRELYKASHLQYNISASLNNLLALEEFSPFADKFACGNWIHMNVDDRLYHLRLLAYEINFDDLSNLPVEFSTAEKTWSGISDVDSIFKSVGSFSSSYASIKQQLAKHTDTSHQINNWITGGIDASQTKLVNDFRTQEIVINSQGILCRTYNNIEDVYDDCQMRIGQNSIYLTDDNWEHLRSAIGKYSYMIPDIFNPDSTEKKTAYGILAEAIVGNFQLSEKMGINNGKDSLVLNQHGILAKNNQNTIKINPNASKLLTISRNAQDILYLDEEGTLHMSGTLDSATGDFSNISINNGTISDITINNGIINHITANSGNIGDFIINNGTVYSENQVAVISDRELQDNIEPITETYEKIFLETPTYTYVSKNGNQHHFGTVSQEMEELLDNHGISPLGFAPFCKTVKTKELINEEGNRQVIPELDDAGNEQYIYSMRYGEYTMLTVHMVQKLYAENELLKQTIEHLEGRVTALENSLTPPQS